MRMVCKGRRHTNNPYADLNGVELTFFEVMIVCL